MISKYAHLYLGYSYDPQPVFRDTHPNAHDWPEGAVFAITIRVSNLMGKHISFKQGFERTEFFGADGWPLDYPADRKDSFFTYAENDFSSHDSPEFYRALFQRYPLTFWRSWNDDDWYMLRVHYHHRMCNDIDWMTETQFYAMRRHVSEEPVYEHLRRNPPRIEIPQTKSRLNKLCEFARRFIPFSHIAA